MSTATVRRDRLTYLDTSTLIDQYEAAISTYRGRHTNASPQQKRIDYIVDLLSERADHDDAEALTFFEVAL